MKNITQALTALLRERHGQSPVKLSTFPKEADPPRIASLLSGLALPLSSSGNPQGEVLEAAGVAWPEHV